MAGSTGRYVCTGRYDYSLLKPCSERMYKSKTIDAFVWDYVVALITSESQFEERLRKAQEEEIENQNPMENELDHVIALIGQTEQEADQIARVIGKTKGVVAARLEKQIEEIDRRFQALQERKSELENNINKHYLTDNKILDLLEFRKIVAEGLQNPTFEDRRHWLEILMVEALIKNGKLEITCRLPDDSYIVDLNASNSQNGNSDNVTEFRTSRSLKTRRREK